MTTIEPVDGGAALTAPVTSGGEATAADSWADVDDERDDFVTFVLHDEHYAFPMRLVREIIRLPRVVQVPLGPPSLVGLANLRGRVLPVVDLRRAVGLPEREADDRTRVVVVDCGAVVGLVVDRVAAVRSVDPSDIDDAAGVQATVRSDLLRGVIRDRVEAGLVSVLDVARVLRTELAGVGDDGSVGASAHPAAGPATGGAGDALDGTLDAGLDDDTLELVSFVVAGEEYALPVDHVREIVQAPASFTEVPNASSHVLGLMDLRGRLLPVVSLRRMFGLPDAALVPQNRVVVVPLDAEGASAVGVVMDTVRQVLRVPLTDVHPVPAFVAPAGSRCDVESVCRLDAGQRLVSVLAAARMFGEDAAAGAGLGGDGAGDTRHERGDGADGHEGGAMGDAGEDEDDQLVVFRLGTEELGVAVDAVQEIIRVPDRLSRVPGTLDFVEGLVNLRGTVLPVVDLRTRLGLPRTQRDDRQRIVVLTVAGVRTGFVVDAVVEVLRLRAGAREAAPVLSEAQAEVIREVANLPERDRILMLLETSRLLDADDALALAGAAAGD